MLEHGNVCYEAHHDGIPTPSLITYEPQDSLEASPLVGLRWHSQEAQYTITIDYSSSLILLMLNKVRCMHSRKCSVQMVASRSGPVLSGVLLPHHLNVHRIWFLQFVLARIRIDVKFLRLFLSTPEILPNHEECPVTDDEHNIHCVTLRPLRRLEDWEYCNGIEGEKGPPNRHHTARCE